MRRLVLLMTCVVAGMTAPAHADLDRDEPFEVRVPPVPIIDVPSDHVSKVLFLNRCKGGCTIAPGRSDARFNTSSIVDGTSFVTEFKHSDEVWEQVVQCVKELYAPYDVLVTDVDPGENAFHHEAIVAGDWDEIGYDRPVGGVAPSQCIPANNVISFTFANGYPADPIRICSVIGQETAHSYGLEHVYNCADPMTYLAPCGRQFFRDEDTPCGEFEELELCQCGGNAQNSHVWLKTVLGKNPTPVPGPEVAFLEPEDGAEVAGRFAIEVTAMHIRGIGHIDLFINGTQYGTDEGHSVNNQTLPYAFLVPEDLADGVMDIEIRAYNDIGSETIKTVTVTRGEPCSSADQCNDGQQCEDGRCFFPPPTGQMGDACDSDGQCISGVCPRSGDEGYCSELCFPSELGDPCPDGFSCVTVQANQGVCWPASGGGGGGGGICDASGGGNSAGMLLIGFAVLLVGGRSGLLDLLLRKSAKHRS